MSPFFSELGEKLHVLWWGVQVQRHSLALDCDPPSQARTPAGGGKLCWPAQGVKHDSIYTSAGLSCVEGWDWAGQGLPMACPACGTAFPKEQQSY